MIFQEIAPFVRFARYYDVTANHRTGTLVPCDARLFYTLSGDSTIRANGQTFHMTKGSLVLIHPGIEYCLLYTGCNTRYIVFNFDYTRQMSHVQVPVSPIENAPSDSAELLANVYFTDVPELNSVLYVPQIEQIENTLNKAIREYSERLVGFTLNTGALLTQALLAIYRHHCSVFLTEDSRLSEILHYVQKNYKLRITNESVAKEFNYHPNYISKIVKAGTGMPLHQYLLQYRVLKSIQYLESGSHTIGQVAQMCGFYDIYYFSRYFKTIMGVTPSEYMKGIRAPQQG